MAKQGQFKPGQSGNPKGRPKKRTLSEEIRDELQAGDNLKVIAKELIRMGREGDLRAMSEIMDRTEGRPAQTIKNELEGGIQFVEVPRTTVKKPEVMDVSADI